MKAADFSYKNLEVMSEGFILPVVVRGIYKNSTVTNKWTAEFFEEIYGYAKVTNSCCVSEVVACINFFRIIQGRHADNLEGGSSRGAVPLRQRKERQ